MLRFQRVRPGFSQQYRQKMMLSTVAGEGEQEKLALQPAAPQLSSYPGSITD